jgi:DNA replicative helicase MCM subunit Mcm2 (Cdc46/Mcm family)
MSDDKNTQKIKMDFYIMDYRCPNCRHTIGIEFKKGETAPATLNKNCSRCGCSPLKKVK